MHTIPSLEQDHVLEPVSHEAGHPVVEEVDEDECQSRLVEAMAAGIDLSDVDPAGRSLTPGVRAQAGRGQGTGNPRIDDGSLRQLVPLEDQVPAGQLVKWRQETRIHLEEKREERKKKRKKEKKERERERTNERTNEFFINEGKGISTIYFFSSSPRAKTKQQKNKKKQSKTK